MPRYRKPTLAEFTATTTGLTHEGRGIAHIDGKATFLFGALAHETVRFRYTRFYGRYNEGEVTQVLAAAPERTNAQCQHFSVCGGCSLQHMQHDFQIQQKQNALLDLLKHQANVVPEQVLTPIRGNAWGYRRKARIGMKYVHKKEKALVGFRERNGRLLADVARCEVLHPSVGTQLAAFGECIQQLTTRDQLPQLEIAVTDTTTAVILRHLAPLPESDLKILFAFCAQHAWQLYLQPAGADSIHLAYPADADPLLQYELPAYGLTLQFQPQQFVQINDEVNQQMIARALELLDLQPNDRVLDLFCGIGNFSLPIAQHCAQVVGVEGDEGAVRQAQANATLNQLNNGEFYCADLFQTHYTTAWAAQKYDKVLLDPPRAGAKEVLQFLPQWQPKRVVYVSCNPATLARDASHLIAQGYRLKCVGLLDMFPHTQHVEAISLFEK